MRRMATDSEKSELASQREVDPHRLRVSRRTISGAPAERVALEQLRRDVHAGKQLEPGSEGDRGDRVAAKRGHPLRGPQRLVGGHVGPGAEGGRGPEPEARSEIEP